MSNAGNYSRQLSQARLQAQGRLNADTVQLGEKLQIKGDQERRDQMEYALELRAQETLRQAEIKSKAMMDAARQEARELIEKAQQAAEQTAATLIETARAEEDGIRTGAYEAGFQAGYEEGLQRITAETEAQVTALLDSAQTLLDGAFLAEKRVMKAFKKDAHALVGHVAKRIVGEAFEANPEWRLLLIEQAAESLYLSGKVKIVVHPELLAGLRQFTSGTEAAMARMSRFEFTTDEQLAPRQIFVLSEQGHFELTPEIQVENLLTPIARELVLPEPLTELILDSIAEIPAEISEPVSDVNVIIAEPVPTRAEAAGDTTADWTESLPLLEGEPIARTEASASVNIAETASAPAEYVSFDELFFETVEMDNTGDDA